MSNEEEWSNLTWDLLPSNSLLIKKYSLNNDDIKTKKAILRIAFFDVVPPGIEPGTQGFSVLCSTNWAKVPAQLIGWQM